jgi:hypothetical protein
MKIAFVPTEIAQSSLVSSRIHVANTVVDAIHVRS